MAENIPVAPPGPVVYTRNVLWFHMEFRLDHQWRPELLIRPNDELADQIVAALENVFRGVSDFIGAVVRGFRPGSIWVQVELTFRRGKSPPDAIGNSLCAALVNAASRPDFSLKNVDTSSIVVTGAGVRSEAGEGSSMQESTMTGKKLLGILQDLNKNELSLFKWHLQQPDNFVGDLKPLKAGILEEATARELTVQLIMKNYPHDAAQEIVIKVLKEIGRNDLVQEFAKIPKV